jgi:catechol 2,3-dioxygenase-like lactoylglutathione lyase family enzyme
MPAPIQITGLAAVMLGVKDLPASVAFYSQKLGLKVLLQEPVIALLQCGTIMLGLNPGMLKSAPNVVGATEVVLRVPAVREAHRTLLADGIAFVSEPHQITPTDWAAHFRDPDGHLLSIFGPEGAA